jgi:putative acyl-CoA dehydrogenase
MATSPYLREANQPLDDALAGLGRELDAADEWTARRCVERLAFALQASLLVRHAPAEVSDAFCATRLGNEGGRAYGTLPPGTETAAIVERHRPRLG